MLDGLSLEEICGLWYEDIVTLPDSACYSLRIMRPYIRMEGSRMQFGKKTVYPYKLRYVPVCGVLQEALQHRMEHVPARFVKKDSPDARCLLWKSMGTVVYAGRADQLL